MRRVFSAALEQHMTENDRIHVLVGDIGYGMFDTIAKRFPKRFWNTGAAEQAMIGMGVGIALSGHIPVCYSITPFVLWRPAELIRNYIHGEQVPVILVGSGRDRDYLHDGPTHWCEDDKALLRLWHNITGYWPDSPQQSVEALSLAIHRKQPTYINLRR